MYAPKSRAREEKHLQDQKSKWAGFAAIGILSLTCTMTVHLQIGGTCVCQTTVLQTVAALSLPASGAIVALFNITIHIQNVGQTAITAWGPFFVHNGGHKARSPCS